MENPEEDIEGVIRLLTQSPPSTQRAAVYKYFMSNSSFTHPFCRTGSFDNSRLLITAIYRWYKILSPKIALQVNSLAYDSQNLILYVNISQVFALWFIPFYKAPVTLTTVLKLKKVSNEKYYIQSQEDLYQTSEFFKFFSWPFGYLGVMVWQFFATLLCLLGAVLLWPISYCEERGPELHAQANEDVARVEARLKHTFADMKGNGELVTAPNTSQ